MPFLKHSDCRLSGNSSGSAVTTVVDSLFFWKIKIGFRYFFSQGSNYRQSSVVQLYRILPML